MGEEIRFITPFEREYPDRLRNIPDAPTGLYARGKLPVNKAVSVAVIGARDCSDYGKYVAEHLGTFLGRNRVTVVSGMARGIDGISQWAALEAGGTSVGVLGCGVDICYPAGNSALYQRLLEQGTILSEYPPGTPPRAMNFPARNRIVSGLADAVVVIEARNRSGTLITVDMALEQGKEVFVVPGRVTDRLSDGCNKLIKQGAEILLSPEELLEELQTLKERTQERGGLRGRAGYGKAQERKPQERESDTWLKEPSSDVPPELCDLYHALDFYPQSVEQIVARMPSDISQSQAAMRLIQLCVDNKAVQVSPGYFKSIHNNTGKTGEER